MIDFCLLWKGRGSEEAVSCHSHGRCCCVERVCIALCPREGFSMLAFNTSLKTSLRGFMFMTNCQLSSTCHLSKTEF
ncbi:mCG148395 [Mus musculus]|nr:mCG148395 [Mus musculus]